MKSCAVPATGGILVPAPAEIGTEPEGACLEWAEAVQGSLYLTFRPTIELDALGVTGVTSHATTSGGVVVSDLTTGVITTTSSTYCERSLWGDRSMRFSEAGDDCDSDGIGAAPADVRTLFWSTTAEQIFVDPALDFNGFCIGAVRLIDDSFFP